MFEVVLRRKVSIESTSTRGSTDINFNFYRNYYVNLIVFNAWGILQ